MAVRLNPWLLTLALAVVLPAAVVGGLALLWSGAGFAEPGQPPNWWLLGPALALVLLSLGCGALVSAFVAARSPRGGAVALLTISGATAAALVQIALFGWSVWQPLWWTGS